MTESVNFAGVLTIPKHSMLSLSKRKQWSQEEVIEHLHMNLGFRIKLGTWDWSEDDDT